MSKTSALTRCLTAALFEDRLNNSIKSIKKINITRANKANKKYFNISLVKYL